MLNKYNIILITIYPVIRAGLFYLFLPNEMFIDIYLVVALLQFIPEYLFYIYDMQKENHHRDNFRIQPIIEIIKIGLFFILFYYLYKDFLASVIILLTIIELMIFLLINKYSDYKVLLFNIARLISLVVICFHSDFIFVMVMFYLIYFADLAELKVVVSIPIKQLFKLKELVTITSSRVKEYVVLIFVTMDLNANFLLFFLLCIRGAQLLLSAHYNFIRVSKNSILFRFIRAFLTKVYWSLPAFLIMSVSCILIASNLSHYLLIPVYVVSYSVSALLNQYILFRLKEARNIIFTANVFGVGVALGAYIINVSMGLTFFSVLLVPAVEIGAYLAMTSFTPDLKANHRTDVNDNT